MPILILLIKTAAVCFQIYTKVIADTIPKVGYYLTLIDNFVLRQNFRGGIFCREISTYVCVRLPRHMIFACRNKHVQIFFSLFHYFSQEKSKFSNRKTTSFQKHKKNHALHTQLRNKTRRHQHW